MKTAVELSGQVKTLAVLEHDYVWINLREILAVFRVNGNEHAGLQRFRQPLEIIHGRVPARMGVDEVDGRVLLQGGDFVCAEVVGVASFEISKPLRVDDVDGGGGLRESLNEAEAGHLAEVKECFGVCVEFLTLDPAAIKSRAEISEVGSVGFERLVLTVSGENSYLGPVHRGRVLRDLTDLFEHPCGVDVDDEEFVGSFARPIGGDEAVDVLRGRQQE